MTEQSLQPGFRTDPALVRRIDEFARSLGVSRNAAINILVRSGLELELARRDLTVAGSFASAASASAA